MNNWMAIAKNVKLNIPFRSLDGISFKESQAGLFFIEPMLTLVDSNRLRNISDMI